MVSPWGRDSRRWSSASSTPASPAPRRSIASTWSRTARSCSLATTRRRRWRPRHGSWSGSSRRPRFSRRRSDSPRLYRVWEGTLDVAGASDRDARCDRHRQSLHRERGARSCCARATALSRRDARAARRLPARARRRERRHHLLVRRRTEPRDRSGRRPGAPTGAEHPAGALLGPARRARLGRFEHDATFERYADRITLQIVDVGAALDREIEWTDLDAQAPTDRGDYYYLRVNQLDGARAWSSPWWVGGERREKASQD